MKRDSQRSKVYAWESANIAIHDRNVVTFDQIEPIVRFVWSNEGLQFPPLVEKINGNKAGDATRLCVRFQKRTYTWIILHELSHSMCATADGYSNKHGSLFLGLYLRLCSKYLGLNLDNLKQSAKDFGLEVSENAVPLYS